jgi:hypothetical protein
MAKLVYGGKPAKKAAREGLEAERQYIKRRIFKLTRQRNLLAALSVILVIVLIWVELN